MDTTQIRQNFILEQGENSLDGGSRVGGYGDYSGSDDQKENYIYDVFKVRVSAIRADQGRTDFHVLKIEEVIEPSRPRDAILGHSKPEKSGGGTSKSFKARGLDFKDGELMVIEEMKEKNSHSSEEFQDLNARDFAEDLADKNKAGEKYQINEVKSQIVEFKNYLKETRLTKKISHLIRIYVFSILCILVVSILSFYFGIEMKDKADESIDS
jgi:hypothetical protein